MKKRSNRLKGKEKLDHYNTLRRYYVQFIDGIIRGLLAFALFGIIGFLLLVYLFKMPTYYFLPFALIGGVLISPFLSKIKMGEKIIKKYEQWLLKIIKK